MNSLKISFGVRRPCHRFVFAGLAGGLYTLGLLSAAGKAGEHKAVAWPPHFERKRCLESMEDF